MKKIICLTAVMLVMCLMFTAVSVSAGPPFDEYMYFVDIRSDVDLSYKEEILSHFYPERFGGRTDIWEYYNMLYAHTVDSLSEPEYVVFIGLTGIGEPAFVTKNIGEYLVMNSSIDCPYDLGYYVYVPAQQKVYTLEEAWESEELDITKALETGKVGIHRGDINLDRSCDILDATYIQMYLAGFEGYEKTWRMNFDKSDEDVNVLDATALQRYLVGFGTNE